MCRMFLRTFDVGSLRLDSGQRTCEFKLCTVTGLLFRKGYPLWRFVPCCVLRKIHSKLPNTGMA